MRWMSRSVALRAALLRLGVVVSAVVVHGDGDAQASIVVDFTRITANSAQNVEDQFQVTIYGQGEPLPVWSNPPTVGANQVLMVVTNNVGIASSVSEFYLDDGTVVSGPTIYNSLTGFTSFAAGANPGDLPGGNSITPAFSATSAFSADAQGNPNEGVDAAADAVGFLYSTTSGLTGIQNALADGSLRIGMHVRSIGTGSTSDSFVNTPPVPEPASVLVWSLLGVIGLCVARKRQSA